MPQNSGRKLTKQDILNSVLEDAFSTPQLPAGITIHAIEECQTFGDRKTLRGVLIVEEADGSLHRITGREMSDWNESLSPFLKKWRLPD